MITYLVCVCARTRVRVYVRMHAMENRMGFIGAGVPGCCVLPGVGTGIPLVL